MGPTADSSRVTRGGHRQAAKGRVRPRAAVMPACSQRGSCCPPLGDAVQRAVQRAREAGRAGRQGGQHLSVETFSPC